MKSCNQIVRANHGLVALATEFYTANSSSESSEGVYVGEPTAVTRHVAHSASCSRIVVCIAATSVSSWLTLPSSETGATVATLGHTHAAAGGKGGGENTGGGAL